MNAADPGVIPTKVALVTGASAGIGRKTVDALTAAGFLVVASARNPADVARLAEEGLVAVRIDVTDERSMVEGVAEAQARTGRVDVLVNTAGFGLSGPIELLAMEDLRHQFETNVFGLVRMTQLVLPGMRQRGAGRIINIGSVGGEVTLPGEGAYHATKYAVEAISDALRVEVGQFGIEVVLIQPTGVQTDFFRRLDSTISPDAVIGPYAAMMTNYRRMIRTMDQHSGFALATPEAVANAVVRAATAEHPAARSKVGWSASLTAAARRILPDSAWDGMMRRLVGVPGPHRRGGVNHPAASADPVDVPRSPQ